MMRVRVQSFFQWRVAIGALMGVFLSTWVRAEMTPEPGATDARVRTVVYDAAQVYRLQGYAGYAIDLEFGTAEVFEGLGAGDIEGVSFVAQGNHVFLKPKAARVATNLTLLTNRHTYQFDYTVSSKKPDPAVDDIIYSLAFQYPKEAADELAAAAEAKRLSAALVVPPVRTQNRAYEFCGPRDLRPTAAWDDGVETYLVFPPRVDFPAPFVRNDDGTESLVNFTVENDAIVLHRISRTFVLRRGKLAGCIVNEGYAGGGVSLPSGTVAPDVQRVNLGSAP